MIRFGIGCILAFSASQALPCSCANPGRSMWASAGVAHVVRIEQVEAGKRRYGDPNNCAENPDECEPAQIAQYVELERIGNGAPLPPTLSSGYGGGDCGLPLLAGTVFIVFPTGADGDVSICNAVGPYRAELLEPRLESDLLSFIDSLRKAAAHPGLDVLTAPRSMPLQATPILPPPPPK